MAITLIADLSGWEIAGWILLGIFVAVILFLAWVWVESEMHERRLQRMQRETMEARQQHENWCDRKRSKSPR